MRRFFAARFSTSLPFWLLLINIGAAFQITGISAGVDPNTGQLPFRQPINQFASSGAAFDLFILSLRQLQNTNQSALLSYFQIAGIHGYPHIPWDGVVGAGGYPGYCTHVAVPFPTWHRPYMVLYEQALWNNAQAIAQTYPLSQRQEYASAAITMRIPYWDWAAYPSLPDVVAEPTISVNTPNGYTTIDNPLYNYTFQGTPEVNGFPSGDPMAPFPWTVRQWNAGLQMSNQSASNASLWAQAPTILAMTYQLFTTVTDYTSFSCTNPGGRSNTANNIENIHNSIHNSIGGWGHMTFPEVSAFDPVFYLHHANVDRIFALWQALNPDSYVLPTVNTYGTYYELQGFVDSGNTGLAPFHSDNGTTMYTSDDVRGTRRFGYTYPELADWNISAADLVSNVRYEINLLYNPSAISTTRNVSRVSKFGARTVDISQAFSHIGFEEARNLGVNNMDMQWFINLRVQRYAFTSAFTIDFFIGAPVPNPMSWSTASNLIGSHAQFIGGNVSMMYPYGAPRGIVHGEVSLTHSLAGGVSRGIILDLSAGSVVPLLTEHLNWRARSADGREIDVGSLRGLCISIGSKSVRPATSRTEFPTYGQVQWHPAVTRGKTGGALR